MSWSVNIIGKPENVALALDNAATKLDGQSRIEYEAALPALRALVENNFAKEGSGYVQGLVQVEASGHGVAREGEQVSRTCVASLRAFYADLV